MFGRFQSKFILLINIVAVVYDLFPKLVGFIQQNSPQSYSWRTDNIFRWVNRTNQQINEQTN